MDQTIVAQYSLIAAAIIAACAALAAAFSDSKAAATAGNGRQTLHQHARSYRPYRIYSDHRYRYRSRTRIR